MFGIGGGKSKTVSTQESDSYGYQGAVSGSQDLSTSTGLSRESVFGGDIFSALYGNASLAAKSAVANAGELMTNARQLFTGGTNFLQSLGQDEGSAFLKASLTGENPVLAEQIANLKQEQGSFFLEDIMPGIKSRAVAGGTLGGGRQGVAEGIAAGKATQAFTQGATALRAADLQQKYGAAQTIAGNTLTAASTGLGALPTLLDISERGANEELGVYSTLSGILGGPTTLTESEQRAQSMADAFSRSFGEDTSRSRGKSTSKSFDFKI